MITNELAKESKEKKIKMHRRAIVHIEGKYKEMCNVIKTIFDNPELLKEVENPVRKKLKIF